MKCTFCGNEVEEGAKYCPVCGTEAVQKNDNTDNEQSAVQYEDPNKQSGYGQGGYGYDQPDDNQGGYSYGQPDSSQSGYGYGRPDGGQSGYGYSQSNGGQNGYGYGQSDGGQDQSGNSQGGYDGGQPGNGYSQQDYSQPNYSQQAGYYGQPNYGQPVNQIKSTPYLIFSILTTICCCLPLGIVGIVYASRIESLQRMGDYEGAQNAAKKAKMFIIIGVILGAISSVGAGAMGVYDAVEELGREITDTPVVSEPLDEDEEEDKPESKSPAPAKASEDLGDSWKSYTVQINGIVLTFPCSIEEVEATGLMMDTETTPEDYVVNKDDYETVFFEDDEYHSLMFTVSNNTDEARTVRECTVNGVYVSDYDVEEGYITAVFPGGVQIGTDIETVIEKWGEPDEIYEGDYSDGYYWYDGDGMNYCMVDTDPDEDEVIMIDLNRQDVE